MRRATGRTEECQRSEVGMFTLILAVLNRDYNRGGGGGGGAIIPIKNC